MTTTHALAPPQRLTRDDMAQLATTEYARTLEQLRLLAPADWARPTDCSEWDVRALVAHLVGTVESSTLREQFRVALAGTRATRRRHRPRVDGMNSIHVAERAAASPAELVDRLRKEQRGIRPLPSAPPGTAAPGEGGHAHPETEAVAG